MRKVKSLIREFPETVDASGTRQRRMREGQDAESPVDGIVVDSTDKQTPHTHPFLVGIRVVNAQYISLEGKFQSANKFVTVIGKHLAASIRCLNLCLHIGHKGTIFPRHFGVVVFHSHIIIFPQIRNPLKVSER